MKRRRFTNEEKSQIVLLVLKGLSVAEICSEHGIGQVQYYKWRDQFMSNISIVFNTGKPDTEKQRLMSENTKLKTVIGDLTLELKKPTSGYETWALKSCKSA